MRVASVSEVWVPVKQSPSKAQTPFLLTTTGAPMESHRSFSPEHSDQLETEPVQDDLDMIQS